MTEPMYDCEDMENDQIGELLRPYRKRITELENGLLIAINLLQNYATNHPAIKTLNDLLESKK